MNELGLQSITAQWNNVLDALLERDRIAWLAFFDARLMDYSDGVLTISFIDAQKFSGDHNFSIARNPKHLEMLNEAIESTYGRRLVVVEK